MFKISVECVPTEVKFSDLPAGDMFTRADQPNGLFMKLRAPSNVGSNTLLLQEGRLMYTNEDRVISPIPPGARVVFVKDKSPGATNHA